MSGFDTLCTSSCLGEGCRILPALYTSFYAQGYQGIKNWDTIMTAILNGMVNAALVVVVSIGEVVIGNAMSGAIVSPVVLLIQKPSVDPLHAGIVDSVLTNL